MNLLSIYPKLTPRTLAALQQCILAAELSTSVRRSFFFSQLAHESAVFTVLEENLFYSAHALQRVFPKYFPTAALANTFARQPEMIANRVYANRMGNGTEESGDGWRYRGRGFIQLTGRNNYVAFARTVGKSVEDVLQWAGTPGGAAASAVWFWTTNRLNRFADAGDFTGLTRAINGGLHGMDHRLSELKKWG